MAQIHSIDPRDGARHDGVEETTTAALDEALAGAGRAGEALARTAPAERAALLEALADAIDADVQTLVTLADRETALGRERLTGEVARTSGQLRLFAEVVREGSFLDATIDHAAPPAPDLRRVLEPIGPVLVFAASNFPFAFSVLGGDTASALAAGCPVVVKAHEGHPALSLATAELIERAGIDAVQVIFGVDAGRRALVDPRIKACGFTGSAAGGRSLFDAASARPDPIPFYGELGSVNPVVVTPGALAARGPEIAEGFLGSFTLGGGQFCTKPGLLFLPAGHGLAAELQRLVGTSAAKAMLNSRIRDGFVTLTGELEATGIVDLIAAGEAAPDEGAWAATRLYVTSAAELLRDPELVTAERFGPSSIVVEYEGVDELEAALGALEGSLAAGIHAEQGEEFPVDRVVDALRRFAGRVLWNGWPTGVAVAWAQHHGGPWPATTSPLHTSVGAAAIRRWLRPLVYQDFPADLLPPALRDENPWNLPRRVDGALHLADR